MAEQKRSVGAAGGLSSLYWLAGAAVAWFKTPAFIGWAGVGKSWLVGAGTAVGASIVGFAGGLVGGAVGLMVGIATGAPKRVCVPVGVAIGAIPMSIVGAFQGYDLSKEWLTATAPAPTAASAPVVSAPTPAVTPLVAAPGV